jgi:hypothetical protein
VSRVRRAGERVCVITRRRNGVVVSRRTIRRAYDARGAQVVLNVKRSALTTRRTGTVAVGLTGRFSARYVATPSAKRLGCPTTRATRRAGLVATRR